MTEHNSESYDAQTGVLFPLRRRLTLILLSISLLLMVFGVLTSPVDDVYNYVMFWTFATAILFLSIITGIYDIIKTYFETRLLYEKMNGDDVRTVMNEDQKKELFDE
ncbi:MAG: hypothetical protein LBG58_02840 [Planctomycetaceae bacterium]|jgi:uncharacterized ion transporter superfamily protein YfcC|nr:hypothetical protein [Planctomycetaceae bacterium]